MWEPTHVGNHLGLMINLREGELRAPTGPSRNYTPSQSTHQPYSDTQPA
jgi:hypothetical protein